MQVRDFMDWKIPTSRDWTEHIYILSIKTLLTNTKDEKYLITALRYK